MNDDLKLVVTAIVLLTLFIVTPPVLILFFKYFYFSDDTIRIIRTFSILLFIIITMVTVPLVWLKTRKKLIKNYNISTKKLPLNPMADIKNILAVIKPNEKIISSKKAKSKMFRHGGKYTHHLNNYHRLSESFPYVIITETDKAYYIDRRLTMFNHSILFLIPGAIIFIVLSIIIPDNNLISRSENILILSTFVIAAILLGAGGLIILMLVPFHYIRYIKKELLTINSADEDAIEIKGKYPRASMTTLNPSPSSVFGLEFHYKLSFRKKSIKQFLI